MLLVIWEHLADNWIFEFVITGPIKMPLFFAISGYLFNDRGGDARNFLKRLFYSIILPWFLLSLVWMKAIYALIIRQPDRIPEYLYSFVSGSSLWFFPCLIIAECVFFCVKKFIPLRKAQYAVMSLLSAVGLLINGGGRLRFALWDNALVVQAYFLFGYWFKENEAAIRAKIPGGGIWKTVAPLAAVFAALIAATLFFYPGEFISVHHARYYNIPICAVLCFIALLLLFALTPRMKKFPRYIVFVGQNTLLFYIGHYWPREAFSLAARYLHFSFPDNVFGYLAKFIIICAVMTVLALLFNKYLPFAVGKKRRIAK